jgi:two-component system, NtrC family, sensor kinase
MKDPELKLDCTALPGADEDLANDNYLLAALLENTTDNIYFKDLESRFVRINRTMARVLRVSDPSETFGKSDQDFFAAEHAVDARRDEIEIICSGQPLIGKEEKENWPDGSITWVSTSKMPLFNSAGRCIGTFGISRDITETKLAEMERENAQRDAALIIDSVPSILISLDFDGRVSRWNPAAAGAFGHSKEAVTGKAFGSCGINWISEDIDSQIRSSGQQISPMKLNLRFEKNGEERKLGLTLKWVYFAANQRPELLIIGADITERERAKEELLWKTAFLEAQVDSTGDGILVADPKWKPILLNRQFQRFFKLPQDLIDRNDAQLLLDHVLGITKDPKRFLEEVIYQREHFDQATRGEVELLDGTVLERYSSSVLGQDGGCFGRIWTFRDITERKRTEDVLRRLSLVVEQSPVSVVVTNLQGEIVYVNRKFTEASGYEVNEVLGLKSNILKSGHTSPADYRQLWETIKAGNEWRGVFHNRRKNGELYWESAMICPIENQDGTVTHFVGIKEDITEKLTIEAQLRQSQKLESIGQLSAGIAHEINTPIQYVGDNASFLKESWGQLAALLVAAQKLRDEADSGTVSQSTVDNFDECSKAADVEYLSREIPRAIDQSLEGVRRVARIVSAMKEFSHPGSEEKRAIDLNRAIETTVTISRNEWKYVATVQTRLDSDLPLVPCLAGEINQVVLNLVVNAAHAIADVPKREGNELGTITLSTRRDGGWVEVSVADTGTGIPDHARERVFDPFFTTKEVGKGTGQGLMLAHTVVVKKHGGRIWFDTEVGKGTTFFFRLPLEVAGVD